MSTTATSVQTLAVVGNPNVGKSTLFNRLTGLHQRVANFPGVTVDARVGELTGQPWRLTDLPGCYSLRPRSLDESVVERVLRGHVEGTTPPDVVLVVLDATNLRRSLYLLSEVADLGLPLVVALNMIDEAQRAGLQVPVERLRETLGVPVVETVATTGQGVPELIEALGAAAPTQRLWSYTEEAQETAFAAADGSSPWEKAHALSAAAPEVRQAEILARYAAITEILSGADSLAQRRWTQRLDQVALHPLLGPPLFVVVMGLVFQAIFAWAGPLMDLCDTVFGSLGELAATHLPAYLGATATSLIVDGVIAGVGSVLIFLPQILILFLFIGFLEDTGYMGRAAFLVDRPLRAVGLSGRAFIPLLSGFACAIPGIMATRTIPSRFERLLTVFLTPLMTCSARLPVYALLIAAFVPARDVLGPLNLQGLVLLGLYLGGVVAAVLIAFLASRHSASRGKRLPVVVELPPYRWPPLRNVLTKLRLRGGDFVRRAGTIIFAVTVLMWVLMTYPKVEAPADLGEQAAAAYELERTFAGQIGKAIEPTIRPLGYDWKIGVGLIASFAAREVFVSTMGVVYALGDEVDEGDAGLMEKLRNERHADGTPIYTLPTVASLLAFFVIALQCGSTVAIVRREAGWPFAIGQLVAFLALAWIAAFGAYHITAALVP